MSPIPYSTGNFYDADFKFQATDPESNHTAHLKSMADRYELWILLPDVSLYHILVYKEAETIKVYRKDKLKKQPDTLLEQFVIPNAIKSKMIRVKEFDYGIKIIMPKRVSDYAAALSRLPADF